MFFNDGSPEDHLDDIALSACQAANYGNAGNWFFSFRGGLNGLRSRKAGLAYHTPFVFEWLLGADIWNREHHVAAMFFCMDSAMECFVFALNALGQAIDPQIFREVTNESALRKISPRDVTGPGRDLPLQGYAEFFPSFQKHMSGSAELIRLIVDNHDVSKHRSHGLWGGTMRNDPPSGFFERLGLSESDPRRVILAPYKSVKIPKRPKLPMDERPSDLANWTQLEKIVVDYETFMATGVRCALNDAMARIQLGGGA